MRNLKNDVQTAILPTGLKVAMRRCAGASVEYCGIVVRAGSRDDGSCHGLAHFVEHTMFKGTEKRTAWHIINRMERVGGELNAYTTKEETVVYTAAPTGNLDRAMELLSDLAISSRFPHAELEKEREVVCDEINSYLDTPSEAVFDDFEDLAFAGSSLGHNILGTEKAVHCINSEECRDYLHKWYVADNMALFYYGPATPTRVLAVVEKHFSQMPNTGAVHEQLSLLGTTAPFNEMRQLDLHQTHTVMGSIVPGMYSPLRHALSLLTNLLGGPGMNSLLNVQLREKRGLVYSVDAATGYYTDCGLFTVYYGCDASDTAKCADIVRRQINDIAEHGLNPRALAQAKKQYLGQLAVASDNRENLAISTGRALLYYNEVLASKEIEQRIMDIDNQQMRQCAQIISNLSMLTFC